MSWAPRLLQFTGALEAIGVESATELADVNGGGAMVMSLRACLRCVGPAAVAWRGRSVALERTWRRRRFERKRPFVLPTPIRLVTGNDAAAKDVLATISTRFPAAR